MFEIPFGGKKLAKPFDSIALTPSQSALALHGDKNAYWHLTLKVTEL